MNFKERLKLVNSILIDCPYDTQKEEIIELFEKTKNNVRKDILCRLATNVAIFSKGAWFCNLYAFCHMFR